MQAETTATKVAWDYSGNRNNCDQGGHCDQKTATKVADYFFKTAAINCDQSRSVDYLWIPPTATKVAVMLLIKSKDQKTAAINCDQGRCVFY